MHYETMRKKPVQERSKAMVAAILEATARVLVEDGYDHASTNRIAKRAGVSVGSLYQYFDGKEALVETLAHQHVQELISAVLHHFQAGRDDTIEALTRHIVEALVAAHRVDPELHRVLVTQTPVDVHAQMHRLMETALSQDMAMRHERGENRIVDADFSAFLVVAATDGAITEAVLRRPDLLEDGRLVDGLTEMIVRYATPVRDPSD